MLKEHGLPVLVNPKMTNIITTPQVIISASTVVQLVIQIGQMKVMKLFIMSLTILLDWEHDMILNMLYMPVPKKTLITMPDTYYMAQVMLNSEDFLVLATDLLNT